MPPKRVIKARSYPRVRDESSDEDEELNELFRQAFAASTPEQTHTLKEEVKKEDDTGCKHIETLKDSGLIICSKCGLQVGEYEDSNDSIHDSQRIQHRKVPDKGISKDLEFYNFPVEVIHLADKFYSMVTNGDIKRSNLRKGIMFACVFYAYKEMGNPQTPDSLREIFGITRKNVSKGLTYFCLGCPRRNLDHYISAEHFIPQVFKTFGIKEEHIEECLQLFKTIEHKSSLLNRANPQSVSKGVVFYYLRKMNSEINVAAYSKEVDLSEVTINRICNTIDSILTPNGVI
jgi:transcription initiation factor TFIIIB Brf1 subunit/transcription initiation factor TFIIB